jgi:CRP-like cAMP-binding protein
MSIFQQQRQSTVTSLLLKLRRRDDVSLEEEEVVVNLVGEPQRVAAKSDIVREGERPSTSALLVEGFAGRYKILGDGSRQITALHVPGDLVDFHSFLLKEMDHGVVALSECVVAKVPHVSLLAVSETHPHLMRLFSLSALIDAAIHREWLVCMGRRRATEHLAHVICEVYQLLETVRLAVNFEFSFPVTQMELADALGLSAVHTNRAVQSLRHEGLLTWENHHVKIHHWTRLSEFAGFDSRYLHLTREPR